MKTKATGTGIESPFSLLQLGSSFIKVVDVVFLVVCYNKGTHYHTIIVHHSVFEPKSRFDEIGETRTVMNETFV